MNLNEDYTKLGLSGVEKALTLFPEQIRSAFGQVKNEELRIKNFENLDENQIKDLAKILQSSIKKLKKIHAGNPHYAKKPFGYNFYIYPYDSWYLRIIPRFMERAGFEISTGIMVNSVDPIKASQDLKSI